MKFHKKLTETDCDMLAKWYCYEQKNHVLYSKLFEELDLIDWHINPLMVWAIDMADCINKILYIRGFPNIGAYIKKYSREGKWISLNEYIKALQNLGVSAHYDEKDQKRFFNYCS